MVIFIYENDNHYQLHKTYDSKMEGEKMVDQKYRCVFRDKTDDKFLSQIVETLGPVLLGSKPAELISLPKHDSQWASKLSKIESHIGKCKKIRYKIFNYRDTSIKVLFYNPKTLDDCLRDKRNRRFLEELGYPKDYNLNDYLLCLIEKMETGYIPDEIGVFLGYPFKDIIGFMGHPSLKLTKVNGWRVYGNPKLSDIKFREFLDARNEVRALLQNFTPEKVLVYI